MIENTGTDELVFRTRAGNELIVWGKGSDAARTKIGRAVLDTLNRNFTLDEIAAMSVIVNADSMRYDGYARHGTFTSKSGKKSKMMVLQFGDDAYASLARQQGEFVITHELVHARRYFQGQRPSSVNEEYSTELETVGRVSLPCLERTISGYYYNHPKLRYLPQKDRVARMRQVMLQDRMLLNGAPQIARKGAAFVDDVKKKFRRSFLTS